MRFSTEFKDVHQAENRGRQLGSANSQETFISPARASSPADRLAEAARFLEHLDQERASLADTTFGRILEERLISRELLDLELQDFDDEVERLSASARNFLTREMTATPSESWISKSEGCCSELCRSAS